MRVVHLCFQLHEPYALRPWDEIKSSGRDELASRAYFDSAQEFAQCNERIYQPLFALLERNVQKYRDLHFSLQVSGLWLELAERYDAALVKRLQKLLKSGQVELIAGPFYHSLALFYDEREMSDQVHLYQERAKKLFDKKPRFFAMPDFLYNNTIAEWVEEAGFAGMLVAGSAKMLGRHTAHRIYEAKGCEYLRLLVGDSDLTRSVADLDADLMIANQEVEQERPKKVLSAANYIKKIELAALRGNVVNLYFEADVIAKRREVGIIRFFDEFFALWLDDTSNCFLNAAETSVVEEPRMELDIHDVVGRQDAGFDQEAQLREWRKAELGRKIKRSNSDDVKHESAQPNSASFLPVLAKTTGVELPRYWRRPQQIEALELLYGLRREVLASEDQDLVTTFRRLTALDYIRGLDEKKLANWRQVLDDLRERVQCVKKAQAVEISRNYTKKRERVVIVEPEPEAVEEETVPVAQEVKPEKPRTIEVQYNDGEAETNNRAEANDSVKTRHRTIRKIVRKLVIE